MQVSRDNHMKNSQRLYSVKTSMKREEGQARKIVEHMKRKEKGKIQE